jgi:hypothetical protein
MEGIPGQASWAVSTASGSVEMSERRACAVPDNRTRERPENVPRAAPPGEQVRA